jgi:hypothetical protein
LTLIEKPPQFFSACADFSEKAFSDSPGDRALTACHVMTKTKPGRPGFFSAIFKRQIALWEMLFSLEEYAAFVQAI